MAGLAGAAFANAENPNINPSPSMTDFVVFSIFNLSALKSLAHFVGSVGTSMAVSSTTVKGWIGAHSAATISRYRSINLCACNGSNDLPSGRDRPSHTASVSARDCNRGRINEMAFDPLGFQHPMDPEAVVPSLLKNNGLEAPLNACSTSC
jgi:hypothetical protein